MTMLSYAQNGEDVILRRLFPEGDGFFIDVGANDPVDSSVTKLFSERGWRGINLEPEPAAFARMVAGRPHDINLNVGISDREGVLTFFDAVDANGWSTFSPEQAANMRAEGRTLVERQIPVLTLAQVCERHATGTIQFLKVDAESHEFQVLAGADWTRWRPRVILVESNGWVHWEPGLIAAGYHFVMFDGINRFYLRDEDRHLTPKFATMANFADDFIPYAYHKVIQDLERRLEAANAAHAEIAAIVARAAEAAQAAPPVSNAEAEPKGATPWTRNVQDFLARQSRALSLVKFGSRRAG